MKKVKKINNCRLCESKDLKNILDFGKVPLGNDLALNLRSSHKCETYKLKLNHCNNCGHFQLGHEVHSKKLFATNYTYLTGIAPSFIQHFAKYSDWIMKQCCLKKNNIVLDIGSNDGTCLKAFKKKHLNVIGIDPATLPAKIANENKIFTYKKFFNSNTAKKIKKDFGNIDFITSHNVLAHVHNIKNIFENIFFLLKQDGFFCFEVGYFVNVVENNLFDTIYHEHLDYHHATPLVKFLNKIGFQVVNLSTNNIQGGTLRILCRKRSAKNKYQVKKFILNERKMLIYKKNYMAKWSQRINKNMFDLKNFVKYKIKKGSNVCGYGAPTKATLLLKLSKLSNSKIKFTVEDNKLKLNRIIPKSNIKIVGFNFLKEEQQDYIIIFAWNFVDDIIKKLRSNKLKNLKVVVPLPKLHIINL